MPLFVRIVGNTMRTKNVTPEKMIELLHEKEKWLELVNTPFQACRQPYADVALLCSLHSTDCLRGVHTEDEAAAGGHITVSCQLR
jgi:hypothetical protein